MEYLVTYTCKAYNRQPQKHTNEKINAANKEDAINIIKRRHKEHDISIIKIIETNNYAN